MNPSKDGHDMDIKHNVFNNFVSKIRKIMNASSSDVGDNGTLFLGILKNCREESDKKIFQSQIVSFYFKLFEKSGGNQSIQKSMDTLKENIIANFFHGNSSKLEDFQYLARLSADNVDFQRRAIIELKKVMDDLSPNQRKRRRSQMLFRGRRASK
ncbi:Interferon gamma [Fukomys damarensis]|uniref:Interferon gamma n=1 Tax=Fukomys damarensis TaxID=885580 RepID=A0A091D1C3_FUKDA|nr:Interferon gamma [Fukomys damarensis]